MEGAASESDRGVGQPNVLPRGPEYWLTALYGLVLAASIWVWFIAIRWPLWQDETGSYWQISAGFIEVWKRRYTSLVFPAYSYILWFWTRLFGTGELTMRALSILAMLGAVYLLYRSARELFDRDCSIIAAIVFCLNPIVVFAAIDVRPYAFGVLAGNAAIYTLLRLRTNNSNWMAALFGFLSAAIVSFHLLFAAILPALLLGFVLVKFHERKIFWRQLAVALLAFVVTFLPLIPQIHYLFHTAGDHVYERPPDLQNLAVAFVPGWTWGIFGLAALLVFAVMAVVGARRPSSAAKAIPPGWQILFCAALAVIPILIFFGVSEGTSIHLFVPRHRLIAVPGLSLGWALLLSSFRLRVARLLFMAAFVVSTAYFAYHAPLAKEHGFTWKYALAFAAQNAAADNAPVVICSDFPEADYAPMPLDSPKTSFFFAQLSYYPIPEPVVPLPRALNAEAMRVGGQFVKQAAEKHERFLTLSFRSQATIEWLTQQAQESYSVHKLGKFSGITVSEFVPLTPAAPSR